jgi:hypothetical protein
LGTSRRFILTFNNYKQMIIANKQGYEKPSQQISYKLRLGLREYTIAINVVEQQAGESFPYTWQEVTFPPGTLNYGDLVSAIIKSKYTDDEMSALVNNYLLDMEDTENKAKWEAMQSWRAEAKRQAKEILNKIETGDF